jgi:hypothetical protein
VVGDANAARAAADALGGRVVVKGVDPELLHKTAAGAVHLDPPDVRAVAAELLQTYDAVLVERMIEPGSEWLVSVRTDSLVPVLVVGHGGALTELIDDVAVLPLPVTDVPGVPDAVARLALHAADVAISHGLALLELNPVIANADGAIAVDAVALTTKQGVLA